MTLQEIIEMRNVGCANRIDDDIFQKAIENGLLDLLKKYDSIDSIPDSDELMCKGGFVRLAVEVMRKDLCPLPKMHHTPNQKQNVDDAILKWKNKKSKKI
jgi:hypothetical protein